MTPNHSVSIYVFGLFGILLCAIVLLESFLIIILETYYFSIDDYYYVPESYHIMKIVNQYLIIIIFIVIFAISYYSLSSCRKIAKYYDIYPINLSEMKPVEIISNYKRNNISKKPPNVLGFSITQKQCIENFTIALIGIFACVFVYIKFFQTLYGIYFAGIHAIHMREKGVIIDVISMEGFIMGNLKWLTLTFILFNICCYSLLRCRKIDRYYNQYVF